MGISREEVIKHLEENSLCTAVSVARYKLASRTMTYAYNEGKVFLLTANTTGKLKDFQYTDKGLLHIGKGEPEDMATFDISITGTFEVIPEQNPLFQEGYMALAKKNAQVMGIYNSDMKNEYSLILFKIKEIQAWTLVQALSGRIENSHQILGEQNMGTGFNPDGLEIIRESFRKIRDKNTLNSAVSNRMNNFIEIIETYKKDNMKVNYPEILKSYKEIIVELKSSISPVEVRELAETIKKECRLCMFHADDCFMNIFFLIFKSIEKSAIVEANKLRPTLRSV